MSLFSHVNNAAQDGSFGNNPRPEPSQAQLDAGNYKKGVVNIQGLTIAIENPAYTYRKGTDAKGKPWMCLMQAHYGYIKGYKGNDGDEVDAFVGHVPEADTVYVINQKDAKGFFDEHKVMLGFLSQKQAVDTYQHCFERGWTGLMSVVPCTMEQFKWWLRLGDKSRPMVADRLPYAGLERLDSVIWGGNDGDDLASHSGHIHSLLYQIRQSDTANLALEPLSLVDMTEELGSLGALIESYDALVVDYNKLERKAKQLLLVMQGTTSTIKPVGVKVSKPMTLKGVANVVAWFEMDDGQAVGVFFHNPDKTPKKIDPTDVMISYKWVLNKKDITIVVAPEQGKDLNIRTVAKRIMQLVDKNAPRFAKANADRASLNQKEQDLSQEIVAKEATLNILKNEVATLQAKKEAVFVLQAQTEADLRQREADTKAAEAARLAEEKSARDKAQADKDATDFRLTGSNLPADIAAAGGQQDLLASEGQGQQPLPSDGESTEIERIANRYATELGHPISDRHREFARAIVEKDAYSLKFIANGLNDKGKKVFSEITGVSLPKQQGATWKAIRDWAGVSDAQDALKDASRDVEYAAKAFMRDNAVDADYVNTLRGTISAKIAEGFDEIKKIGSEYWFVNKEGRGANLSARAAKGQIGLSNARPLIAAMIAEQKAKERIAKEAAVTTSAPVVQPTPTPQPKDDRDVYGYAKTIDGQVQRGMFFLRTIKQFLPNSQYKTLLDAIRDSTEEAQFFIDKVTDIAKTIETMPATYGQDGKGDEAIAYLHYFGGSADFYITEKDMSGKGTEQAFGLADIFGDGGEIGYISIDEIASTGTELDLYWTPKTLAEIKGKETESDPVDPQQGTSTEERPAKWRTQLAPARAVAKSLGIETKGKDKYSIVQEINAADRDAHAQKATDDMENAIKSVGGTNLNITSGGQHIYFDVAGYPYKMQMVYDPVENIFRVYYGDNGASKVVSVSAKKAIDEVFEIIKPLLSTTQEPSTPTQEILDRDFLQSIIDEKIDVLGVGVPQKMAELSKVYTEGDMSALIKQVKKAAIVAVTNSVAKATASMG